MSNDRIVNAVQYLPHIKVEAVLQAVQKELMLANPTQEKSMIYSGFERRNNKAWDTVELTFGAASVAWEGRKPYHFKVLGGPRAQVFQIQRNDTINISAIAAAVNKINQTR